MSDRGEFVLKTNIVISKSTNPWFNLAYEEYLLSQITEGEMVFYLWQNAHTVVIGKHQNPWREVNTELLEKDGGKLARRLSGGGAVYHDLGNVNFTFACSKELIDLERQLKVILEAVKSLGIEAEFSGRNDILAQGRKFSGNAFYAGGGKYIHHGTLMLDVDTKDMGKYLNVSQKKLTSKAIASVKSRVINLIDIVPGLTVERLMDALSESFENIYQPAGDKVLIDENSANEKVIEFFNKYGDWDWRYGNTPKFNYALDQRFDWGGVELNLELTDAVVKGVKVYSDSLNVDFIEALESKIFGIPFEKQNFVSALSELGSQSEEFNLMTEDMIGWLNSIEL